MPHILLVEDNQFVSDAVRETLDGQSWRVETCADGYVALLLIKSERRYDLLLLDNELPNVNGLEPGTSSARVAAPHTDSDHHALRK